MEAVQYNAFASVMTHRGRVRQKNEDAAVLMGAIAGVDLEEPIAHTFPPGGHWVIAVVDGIGGARAGSVASSEVAARLAQTADFTPQGIIRFLNECNTTIFDRSQSLPDLAGMGATVAGIACGPEGILAFNVGDSRVFRLRDGFLQQITRDDSTAQMLVDMGVSETGGVRSQNLHSVTQAIGGRLEFCPIEPHVYPMRISGPSRFLLCTDGLSDMVGIDHLESLMQPGENPSRTAAVLMDAAMASGGRDNITVIVADILPNPVTE